MPPGDLGQDRTSDSTVALPHLLHNHLLAGSTWAYGRTRDVLPTPRPYPDRVGLCPSVCWCAAQDGVVRQEFFRVGIDVDQNRQW